MRSVHPTGWWLPFLLASGVACDGNQRVDPGPRDGSTTDAADTGPVDSGGGRDGSTTDGAFDDGGVDGGVEPDTGPRDGGSGTGACANLPCRDQLLDDTAFEALAQPSPEGGCQYDLEVPFIATIDGSAPTYYLDPQAYAEPLDFLRLGLGGAYANLNVEDYFRTFEREDQRTYWVGRIRRLQGAAPYRYAVDLYGSAYWGAEDIAVDLRALFARLAPTFPMPIGYGPSQYGPIRAAGQLVNPGFTVHLPTPCPNEACPPGNGPCVVIPTGAELCGHHQENRDITLEFQNRIRVRLQPGAVRLQADAPTSLVAGGVFGPDALPIVPGTAVARRTSAGGSEQWTIEQSATAGSHSLAFTFSLFNATQVILREPFLEYLGISGTVDGAANFTDYFNLQTCSGSGWSRYYAEADFGGGDRLRVTYRHQLPFAGSGPFLLTEAEVVLGGQQRRVQAGIDLLYAGVHHNWDNQMWILFDVPIAYQGHDVYGVWVDEPGTRCCPVDSIRTLGANHEPLDTLNGASYLRSPSFF